MRCGAVLMIDAVKSKAANALGNPLVRTGINRGRIGEFAVEGSVEDRHLRDMVQIYFRSARCLPARRDYAAERKRPCAEWRL